MSDRAFVADCYQRLLGRPADEDGLAHYAGRLTSGTLTRDALEEILRASDEYLDRQARLSPAGKHQEALPQMGRARQERREVRILRRRGEDEEGLAAHLLKTGRQRFETGSHRLRLGCAR